MGNSSDQEYISLGGMNWEVEIDIHTLLSIKEMANENLHIGQGTLLCGDLPCGDLNGKEIQKRGAIDMICSLRFVLDYLWFVCCYVKHT